MLRLLYLAFLYWWCDGSLRAFILGQSEVTSAVDGDPDSPMPRSAVFETHATDPLTPSASDAALRKEDFTGCERQALPKGASSPVGKAKWDVEQGCFAADGNDDGVRSKFLHRGTDDLKRSAIFEKLTPLTALTSLIGDLDLFADWYFLREGLDGESALVSRVALAFTVVGTLVYVLLSLEFHPVSVVRTWWRGGRPLSPLQHVSLGRQLLLNVVVEDLPQLFITCYTTPSSAAGMLNLVTAVFSLLAKMAEAVATKNDLPMSSQLRMIDTDPLVVRHLQAQRVKAKELADNSAKLAVLVNKFRQESSLGADPKVLAGIAFKVAQVDAHFLDGGLGVIRAKLDAVSSLDLSRMELQGLIPSTLGELTNLSKLTLNNNELEGPIPAELGNLGSLQRLTMSVNNFTGPIPSTFGELTKLKELSLNGNQLEGRIPFEIGNLSALTHLKLSYNNLSGPIPPEIGLLTRLTSLWLGENNLTGSIPANFGNLTKLKRLDLDNNLLAGTIPTTLGSLSSLEWLALSNNKLVGTIPTAFHGLTHLRVLYLEGNQFADGEVKRLRRLLPHCPMTG